MCGARSHRNGETRNSSTTTMPRLTGPLKFRSFWSRTTWKWSPIPHTHPIWPPVTFPFPQAEASDEGSNIRHHWRDSRGITAGTWHSSKKGLAGMLPSMAETLGPLYSCKRGVLWRWWRNLTSKVSKLLLTSIALELLDTPLYDHRPESYMPWQVGWPGRKLGGFELHLLTRVSWHSSTTAEGKVTYWSISARCCNYSLFMLVIIGESITWNM